MPEFEKIATFSDDKLDVVIFDIDGTLAKNISRSPYDMTRVLEDEYHRDIAHLVYIMSLDRQIIYVSGRDDSCREDTIKWLSRIPIANPEWSLYMRKEGDKRNDAIIKYEILKELNKTFNIRYIFDDRDRVVKMAREAGFRVLQVAP